MIPGRHTMKSLRELSHFARAPLARYAGISEDTMRKMEEGTPVSKQSAEKALGAFNRILGTSYSLDDIDVALLD